MASVDICVISGDVAFDALGDVATVGVVPQNPRFSRILAFLYDWYISNKEVIDSILLGPLDSAARVLRTSMDIFCQFIQLLGETALVPVRVIHGLAVTNVRAFIG